MHGEYRRRRWAPLVLLALILVGTLVGVTAYNAGVSHGLAIGAQTVALERGASPAQQGAQQGAQGAPAAPVVVAPPYYYGHYGWHPWGFGFGFGPLLFILFWFFILRMLFWRRMFWCGGGPWRRGGFAGGYRRGGWRYHDGPRDVHEL